MIFTIGDSMTRGKVRVIGHRRRREQRTDYRHRLALLKSGKPRLIIRRSVNSITCQIAEHNAKGDRSLVTVTSRELDKFGWKGRKGNLPGAYLTGMLCGIEAKKKGVKNAVLDTGLHTSTKGSRIYGALKGVLDAGIDVPHSPDVLPPIERIRGLHIEEYSKSKGKLAGVSGMFDDVKLKLSSTPINEKAKAVTTKGTVKSETKKKTTVPKKTKKPASQKAKKSNKK